MDALALWRRQAERGRYLWEWLRFVARLIAVATLPSAYNPAVRDVLFKQIYFTAWQVLGSLTVFALLLSALVAEIVAPVSLSLGLQGPAAEAVLRVVALEALPLLVTFFIALRSGAAINAEIALMSERGELLSWQRLGLNPERLEFMPRLLGGTVAMLALSLWTVGTAVAVLYLSLSYSPGWQLNAAEIRQVFASALSPADVAGLVAKAAVFGVVVSSVPVFEGMRTPRQPHMVPVSVLRGMVRVFGAVMTVWLVWLWLWYL